MNIKNILKKTFFSLGDSVLIYTVLLITAVMYYYRSSLTFLWAIISLFAVRILFYIFDYISKHKYLGTVIYIAVFALGTSIIDYFISRGEEDYSIGFLLWFITTQDALEYSKWYTLAMFVFSIGFFSSVVYYFNKVQYRLSMGFLVFIIPFVIYGKESKQMPAILMVCICMMFILNIIIFSNRRNGETIIAGKKTIYGSVAIFIIFTSLFAAFIPKPKVVADRTYLESLIDMDAFTDMLISRLNLFSDTAESGKFNSLTTNDRVLWYASGDEELRLKTQVFRDYDYNTDKWSVGYEPFFSKYYISNSPSEILNLIVLCSDLDIEFAKKYNIDSTSFENSIEAEKKQLKLYPAGRYSFEMLPVPTFLDDVSDLQVSECEFENDMGIVKNADGRFYDNSEYNIEYFSDSFLYMPETRNILSKLSYENCSELYTDMQTILDENGYEYESLSVFNAYYNSLDAKNFLDYGNSDRIRELAIEITDGLTSDYEKASAIEKYFYSNNYIYDLTYRKSADENTETFLFETKRGVCYEYATAMVMLARACGIPARYAEGYNMNEHYEGNSDNSANYQIRVKSAHGFPELWIQGIGWVSFEPTVSDSVIDYQKTDISKGLYISGAILAFAVIAGFLLLKFYPAIYNQFFLIKVRHSDPQKAVSLIFIRVRSLYGFGKDVTIKELYEHLLNLYKTDISFMKKLFENSAYGQISPTENEKREVIEAYKNIYKIFIENKKSIKKMEVEKCKNL